MESSVEHSHHGNAGHLGLAGADADEVGGVVQGRQPATKSKFKQLQETGKEAEFYFMSNYKSVERFEDGILEDARLWGDGYDFQIQTGNTFLLAEVKGVREKHGSIRMTQNEYNKAAEYKSDYILVIVSNLVSTPKLSLFENPT